uniref:Ig-like domain-containing protein n=1 Tax=Takifugu rubripes TaxID=31033 RepID=A0A3B5KFB8_TAKRU
MVYFCFSWRNLIKGELVGFAGRKVRLPCRTQAAGQGGLEVCWGRGEPSVFNCHNAVINAVGNRVTYRKSYRYSVSSSSSSLSILSSRVADTGYYHCRVQLPGLFNDQIATIHLIIIHRMTVRPQANINNKQLATRSMSGMTSCNITTLLVTSHIHTYLNQYFFT